MSTTPSSFDDSPKKVLEFLVHTYLAKITKPANATEKEAYDKKVEKLISVAESKINSYYLTHRNAEYKKLLEQADLYNAKSTNGIINPPNTGILAVPVSAVKDLMKEE